MYDEEKRVRGEEEDKRREKKRREELIAIRGVEVARILGPNPVTASFSLNPIRPTSLFIFLLSFFCIFFFILHYSILSTWAWTPQYSIFNI